MRTRPCKYCGCSITGRRGEIQEVVEGRRSFGHSKERCLHEQVLNLSLLLKREQEHVRILELGDKNPQHMHARNLREIKALEKAVQAGFSSAIVSFAIVHHGWQCDIELITKGSKPATGTVCRDWGDDGPSSKRLLAKLIKMGSTGEP
jgi:hypothetical protein